MNQIDIHTPALAPIPAYPAGLEPAHRLVVLIPDVDADHLPAMHRIRELAAARQAHILLLGLCNDTDREPSLRRRLIALSAMVQDGCTSVDMDVEVGTNWVTVVKQNHHAGDTIVCFAEQRTGLLHRPLSQILQSNLKMPVYILSGLNLPRPKFLSQAGAWLGFLGIITGFFIMQINIVQATKGGFQTVLLSLSIIPEYWLLWVWNSRLG